MLAELPIGQAEVDLGFFPHGMLAQAIAEAFGGGAEFFALQLQAGLHRRGGAHAMAVRQLPDRRQPLAGTQSALRDLCAQLPGKALVEKHAAHPSVLVYLHPI